MLTISALLLTPHRLHFSLLDFFLICDMRSQVIIDLLSVARFLSLIDFIYRHSFFENVFMYSVIVLFPMRLKTL